MDFELSESQRKLQRVVADFSRTHLTPSAVDALDRSADFPQALFTAMAVEGLLKVTVPQAFGGAGGDLLDAVLVAEELGKHSGTACNIFLVNALFGGTLISTAGSDAQKEALLPALGKGRCALAFALTEYDAGSDAAAIATVGVRVDGDFVINGTKLFTTGAEVADFILTVARTEPGEKASRGSSIFLVPRESPGLEVQPMDKIAGNAFASCEVHYRDVRVSPDDILGGPAGLDHGWQQLMRNGNSERLGVAASSLGMAQAVYEEARAHALRREQFGRPIVGFQAIQHALVDMATTIEAMRWLTYHAAWRASRGEECTAMAAMAKLFASEALNTLVLRAMKILGGQAYLRSCSLGRCQREALLSLYAGGTSEIQKNLIGRFLGLVPGG